jgi:hypothetical protein
MRAQRARSGVGKVEVLELSGMTVMNEGFGVYQVQESNETTKRQS